MREALFIGKLEEPGLNGLLPGWLEVVCVCGSVCMRAHVHVHVRVGWCIVVAAALAGIASSMHSSGRSGEEKRVEIDSLGGI